MDEITIAAPMIQDPTFAMPSRLVSVFVDDLVRPWIDAAISARAADSAGSATLLLPACVNWNASSVDTRLSNVA
jgi:hypothetical protein